jgi:hypothetical protein
VQFAGQYFEGLAIEREMVALVGEDVSGFQTLRMRERRDDDEGEDAGEEDSLLCAGVLARRSYVSSLGRMFQGWNSQVRRY